MDHTDLEQLGINVIRGLAMDAPAGGQDRPSGHGDGPGAAGPRAVDPDHALRPVRPDWPDRDRFVLSNGHASILLYSMLYLTGYGLELETSASSASGDRAPRATPRCTTPRASRSPPDRSARASPTASAWASPSGSCGPGSAPRSCDHHTFVIAGDGYLEEGISHEAASLAGHLGLGRLVYVYDDNHITIDGPTELALTDDAGKRFEAYGWHVEHLGEIANDLDALEAGDAPGHGGRGPAVAARSCAATSATRRPKFTDTAKAHGNPFGADEIRVTKEILGLPPDEHFWVPDEVVEMLPRGIGRGAVPPGRRGSSGSPRGPATSAGVAGGARAARRLPGWESKLPTWEAGSEPVATRQAANKALNAIADDVPGLIAGSADLTGNTGVKLADEPARRHAGRQISLRHPRARHGRRS